MTTRGKRLLAHSGLLWLAFAAQAQAAQAQAAQDGTVSALSEWGACPFGSSSATGGALPPAPTKFPGPVSCPSDKACRPHFLVEAATYRSPAGLACCIRIEYEKVAVEKRASGVPLKWMLVDFPAPGSAQRQYRFTSGKPPTIVDLKGNPPNGQDFDPPLGEVTPGTPVFVLHAMNKQAKEFYYSFAVTKQRQNLPGGSQEPEVDCDPVDPVIINHGN